jgi:REP element-mobilizing transposase RayT
MAGGRVNVVKRNERRRGMRHARVKMAGTGCYHVVSRIVDRAFKLDDGEKEIFRRMMRKAEAFSGVRVLTYAVMSNHFHVLVEAKTKGQKTKGQVLSKTLLR